MARFYGWTVVAGAFAILAVAYGIQFSFGIFFTALLDDFGWSRAALAGAFSLYAFFYSCFGFPAGRLTDRWGPRAVVTCGALLLGGALASMALVSRLWHLYLLYGLVASLGMSTAYVPCNGTVVKWFVRRRGLAVGLASAGGSVGNFVLPPVVQALVSRAGWRAAYVVVGASVFALLVLLARVMRRDPESMGQTPDGDPRAAHTLAETGPPWRLGAAMRTTSLWMLGAAFTATWMPVFVPLVHLVPLARDHGHGHAGAWIMSAVGAGAVAGRLVMGVVSDRIGRKPTIGAAMLLQAAGFLGFLGAADLAVLVASAVVFGYSYGTISALLPALVGDFFGRLQAGSIVGFIFAFSGSTAGIGPIAAGAVYDRTGGYGLAFVVSAALNVLAFGLLLLCRPPRGRPA